MTTTSNKLVDKYQYTQNQIRVQGFAEIITAKHIVLKQLFTLKKITTSNPKTLCKYQGVINQMNILKALNDSSHVFKCHKMLKTSNNLYVVYDLMGKNPTLSQLIKKDSLADQQKKKNITLQIINFLQNLHKKNIYFLGLSSQLIQVDGNNQIKFVNLQSALFFDKSVTSFLFQNIQKTKNTPLELIDFIDKCNFPYQKEIDFNLFSQRLNKADIYLLGKIFQQLFEKENSFIEKKQGNDLLSLNCFQSTISALIKKMVLSDPQQRPSLQQIESVFSQISNEHKRPKIKISRMASNSSTNNLASDLHKSASKSKMTVTRQFLSPPRMDDQFDKKSVRSIKSSGDYTDLSPGNKLKVRKGSSVNSLSETSNDQLFKLLTHKIMKRRNLCKFLLKIAKTTFSLQLIDQRQRVILSFMLIKKSVLLICSLARYISTGKGQSQEFDFNDNVRKQFSKTNDFFKLSVSINAQMDSARVLYQNCINLIINEFPELIDIKQFSFSYQSKSQNINQKYMKQTIKKSIIQVLKKIQSVSKNSQNLRKSSKNLLNTSTNEKSFLTGSVRSAKQKNFLDVQDITVSVKSARTIKSNLSGSSVGEVTLQNFQQQFILRNLSHQSLKYIYLMGLILDFESYQKMFQNLILEQEVQFQHQSLLKKLKRMTAQQIAFKIYQIIH